MVVIRHAKERQPVPEQINRRHSVLDNRPRERNQEPVLHHACNVHGQRRGLPDQEKHSKVEREGAEGVGPEDHEIELEGGGVSEDRVLHEDPGDGEEDEAAGGDVVERGDGVERDPLGGEEDLDHDEARGLEGDGAELEEDAPGIETRLPVGGDADSEGDGEHVEHGVVFVGLFAEEDADGVNGDGH